MCFREKGEGRKECGRVFFGRKEKGERSADECVSGGRRREKGVRTNVFREIGNKGEGESGITFFIFLPSRI